MNTYLEIGGWTFLKKLQTEKFRINVLYLKFQLIRILIVRVPLKKKLQEIFFFKLHFERKKDNIE